VSALAAQVEPWPWSDDEDDLGPSTSGRGGPDAVEGRAEAAGWGAGDWESVALGWRPDGTPAFGLRYSRPLGEVIAALSQEADEPPSLRHWFAAIPASQALPYQPPTPAPEVPPPWISPRGPWDLDAGYGAGRSSVETPVAAPVVALMADDKDGVADVEAKADKSPIAPPPSILSLISAEEIRRTGLDAAKRAAAALLSTSTMAGGVAHADCISVSAATLRLIALGGGAVPVARVARIAGEASAAAIANGTVAAGETGAVDVADSIDASWRALESIVRTPPSLPPPTGSTVLTPAAARARARAERRAREAARRRVARAIARCPSLATRGEAAAAALDATARRLLGGPNDPGTAAVAAAAAALLDATPEACAAEASKPGTVAAEAASALASIAPGGAVATSLGLAANADGEGDADGLLFPSVRAALVLAWPRLLTESGRARAAAAARWLSAAFPDGLGLPPSAAARAVVACPRLLDLVGPAPRDPPAALARLRLAAVALCCPDRGLGVGPDDVASAAARAGLARPRPDRAGWRVALLTDLERSAREATTRGHDQEGPGDGTDGGERPTLAARLVALGAFSRIDDIVAFVGATPRAQIPDALRAAGLWRHLVASDTLSLERTPPTDAAWLDRHEARWLASAASDAWFGGRSGRVILAARRGQARLRHREVARKAWEAQADRTAVVRAALSG